MSYDSSRRVTQSLVMILFRGRLYAQRLAPGTERLEAYTVTDWWSLAFRIGTCEVGGYSSF